MKLSIRTPLAAGLAVMVWSGLAFGQAKGCGQTATPQNVDGQILKIDAAQDANPGSVPGRLTVRATDGTVHEFHATAETLKDLKVGDPIHAQLRSAPSVAGQAGKTPGC